MNHDQVQGERSLQEHRHLNLFLLSWKCSWDGCCLGSTAFNVNVITCAVVYSQIRLMPLVFRKHDDADLLASLIFMWRGPAGPADRVTIFNQITLNPMNRENRLLATCIRTS